MAGFIQSIGVGEIYAIASSLTYAVTLICLRQGIRSGTSLTALLLICTLNALFGLALSGLRGTLQAASWGALGWFVLTGSLGMGVGNLCAFIGIERMGVSRSTPVAAAAPLWGVIFAAAFLGERPGPPVLAGTLSIVGGVALLSLAREKGTGDFRSWFRGALVFPFAASVVLALIPVLAKFGFALHPDAFVGMGVAFGAGTLTLLAGRPFLPGGGRIGADGRAMGSFAAAAAFNLVASSFMWTAVLMGEVTIILPLSRLTPLWVVLLSYFFLGDLERITWPVALAALAVVAGGVLITAFR